MIVLGIASCGVYAQDNTWWNKVLNSNYHQVAEIINRSDRPLIIVDSHGYNPVSMISLSYLLKPDVQFLLLPAVEKTMPVQSLPGNFQSIFLFNLPETFGNQFEMKFQQKLKPAFQDSWNDVWQTQVSTK